MHAKPISAIDWAVEEADEVNDAFADYCSYGTTELLRAALLEALDLVGCFFFDTHTIEAELSLDRTSVIIALGDINHYVVDAFPVEGWREKQLSRGRTCPSAELIRANVKHVQDAYEAWVAVQYKRQN